ncbi:D-2-hydroxyacid dehydrogenase [Haloarchaeobius sp. HME9146]|uniref:D-2-hydroxyacid dehydrogenase n=1 Tax=Haloarchaeobius sp. HME9146 TaxID=2978732 RepID=UPI0021BE3148|nr:D-2-hydroxyacid dehydrogenase [Haloarchaeobius sp. HME9146]MCT9097268.1 D-2-hydroxyacid dehydrogenase [Haloarchaeobius sp. HME9146]
MNVRSVAIDESVSTVFPPERLQHALEDVVDAATVDATTDSLDSYDAVVTLAYHEEYLDAVDWIHSIQTGIDRFPLDDLREHDVTLTSSTGIHGPAIGETVAGYMLSFSRRLLPAVKAQTRREWSPPEWDEAFTLTGEQVCIVGLGALGKGIVDRANGLGMEVVGVRRSGEPVDGVEEVYTPDELHTAIRDARFLVLAVPLVEETRRMVGAEEFDLLDDDAILVNVARGPVVDESALIAALESGSIAGAALDVFETEPLPEDSPLWEFENVLVTPHCAGFTEDYYRNVAGIVRENVENIERGADLRNHIV